MKSYFKQEKNKTIQDGITANDFPFLLLLLHTMPQDLGNAAENKQ